ncbi:MAG: amino acid permease [Candidatus Thioglobus sp.]|nr:amino acid permease [Candidatus Thioglobus pontius]MBL6977013.1 amino acid permease [Candidatus Thioglobus sp.]MBL6984843.1 amino acid permease [Candidatus Thioglobus sp.]
MPLKRTLTLPLLVLYGLGNILGAGIYVLIGKVSGVAGLLTPLSFFVASLLVVTTAFTYSELSSRYPVSAGEAVYLFKAFGNKYSALIIGLMITTTGVLSASTITVGFVGYLQIFIDINKYLAIIPILLLLSALAIWGIKQSIQAAALLTLIEISGLLIIIWFGRDYLPNIDTQIYINAFAFNDAALWVGVFAGAFLAFYAFIGFEDMVNVAEEVKNPEKNMPRAILLSLAIATIIYTLVSLIAVNTIAPQTLAEHDAPLALIYQQLSGFSPNLIAGIGMLAIINGALIQIIMASRVLYGMSRQHWLPEALSRVNTTTGTPIYATILTTVIIAILALWLPIVTLAELTSLFILIIFSLMHLALISIKTNKQSVSSNVRQYHITIPIVGLVTNVGFVLFYLIN